MFRSPQPGDWAADEDDDLDMVASLANLSSDNAQHSAWNASTNDAGSQSNGRSSSSHQVDDKEFPSLSKSNNRLDRMERRSESMPSGRWAAYRSDFQSSSSSYTTSRSCYDERNERDRREYNDRSSYFRSNSSSSRYPSSSSSSHTPLVKERGIVISIKESFGFISCADRDGDLFFHQTEAPVDLQPQDEVEFIVRYNQRAHKDIACQLRLLPKGSIVMEEISEMVYDGIVTKGLPRSLKGFSYSDNRSNSNSEVYGMIEVQLKDPTLVEQEEKTAPYESLKKREFVRFNMESMMEINSTNEDPDASTKSKKAVIPCFGDAVRFKIATHRKNGTKRAVALEIICSAKEKMQQAIDAKLETMEREHGIVDQIKSGGGFIRCCDRVGDIYFSFHEVQDLKQDENGIKNQNDEAHSRHHSRNGPRIACALREGDEVSFYAYEVTELDSTRTRPQLTAMRVQKLSPGTVVFEELLQADVTGTVCKVPKEPRNSAEILGAIQFDTDTESREKETITFRLSDVINVRYSPLIGDQVIFDKVLVKSTREIKAVNIRIGRLKSENREAGMILALKDEFGFIKCCDRTMDAYFRFSDVISDEPRDLRVGSEVEFDCRLDSMKAGNARATRIQVLPPSTIEWEQIIEEKIRGKVRVVPLRRGSQVGADRSAAKSHQKPQPGRIDFSMSKPLIEYLPKLKQEFIAALSTASEQCNADPESGDEAKTEIKFEFPSTLTKYERAAIHQYAEVLKLHHESSGEGSNRKIIVTFDGKASAAELEKKHPKWEIDVEFRLEELADLRYEPTVGDEVEFQLVLVRRTKQFTCRSITCIKAVSKESADSSLNHLPKGEGFITSIKQEGFGFIQRSDQKGENLFFHVKEIVSGETLEDLKEKMEVQFRIAVDEKKKRTRAVHVSVVPSGTVKLVVAETLRGIVRRPSYLHRFKSSKNGRFPPKNTSQTSSQGTISVLPSNNSDERSAVDQQTIENDQEIDEAEATEECENGDSTSSKSATTSKSKSRFSYFINDIVDPSVILREGDVVEFTPMITSRGARASKIQRLISHAKQGVVTKVQDDLSGIISLDSTENEESKLTLPFVARNVLRGDALRIGDRVEFAISSRSTSKDVDIPSKMATSILRLNSADVDQETPSSRGRTGPRLVNSTLRQAMKQVGANAMVSSRMAKGPDGTRGFQQGWRAIPPV